jgi:hypothetical protein
MKYSLLRRGLHEVSSEGKVSAQGVMGRATRVKIIQPRPQGLPRGGARAEEDPGKIR